jgi:hypothetical protein
MPFSLVLALILVPSLGQQGGIAGPPRIFLEVCPALEREEGVWNGGRYFLRTATIHFGRLPFPFHFSKYVNTHLEKSISILFCSLRGTDPFLKPPPDSTG